MAITISGDSPNFTTVAATTITNVTNISSNAADTPVILGDSGTNYNTCRAWVNFNGTGTVAIRADFNVTSITDNNTGDYTVNFTNAMPDANYAWAGSSQSSSAQTVRAIFTNTSTTPTASALRVQNSNYVSAEDPSYASVVVFR